VPLMATLSSSSSEAMLYVTVLLPAGGLGFITPRAAPLGTDLSLFPGGTEAVVQEAVILDCAGAMHTHNSSAGGVWKYTRHTTSQSPIRLITSQNWVITEHRDIHS
jgi:hypothetical protein